MNPAVAQTSSASPPVDRPNVLLIVLDDVGIENLSFYDYDPGAGCCPVPNGGPPSPSRTPNLAMLASEGVVFRRAYSYPLCSSTRAAIMTGKHAFRTGMGHLSSAPTFGPYTLPLCEKTIPEMLKEGFPGSWPKYRCGAFGKWDLTSLETLDVATFMHPIDQGFNRFVGVTGNDIDHFDWDMVDARVNPYGYYELPNQSVYSATVMREQVVTWIQSVSGPFFAYVCFNPPHVPFQVPPFETLSPETLMEVGPYVPGQHVTDMDRRSAYNWMIESVDHEIGQLLAGIPHDKRQRTTVLIVGDNGTPAGALLCPPFDPDHGKGTLYEQGVRVPLIASGYRVAGTGFHDGVVSVVDLWRTIADLTGASTGSGGDDSVSLYGLMQNPQATLSRTEVFVQLFRQNGFYGQGSSCADLAPVPERNARAMVSTEFKYMRYSTNGIVRGHRVFRLSTDPTECTNLVPQWQMGQLSGADEDAIQYLSDAMTALSGIN